MGELKALVLGDGILGGEIVKQTGWEYISRKKDGFNIEDIESFDDIFLEVFDGVATKKYDIIINCIANTDTYSSDRDSHWSINYKFVNDLINFTNNNEIKLIHISTDYVYSGSNTNASEEDVPVHCNNWYGYTKLLADGLVQLSSNNYLICRCTHKPKPFPYECAWIDQVGNFDYVDNISSIIIGLIENNISGLYNVGTDLKNMYQLASSTKKVNGVFSPENTPKNTSMNLKKLEKLKKVDKVPFFSIAIPAYGYNGKGKDFLEFSFFIMESQVFKDFEVVVSDHSTDDTIKNLCESWMSRLNIVYFRNDKGRGIISPNLNVAMSHCRGEWIKILFQDDFLYDSDSLNQTKNFINDNPDVVWVATKFCHTNDGLNMYRDMYPKWTENILAGNNSIGCPSVITVKNKNILYFNDDLNWLMDCEYYRRMYDIHGEPLVMDSMTVVNRTNSGDRLTDTITDSEKDAEINKVRLIYG